ncbi:hypothetical protein FRB97_005156 [Tulasnella sp. 331]|nr:hypothetical protein FRB97_005156 [Tulasnella sp. 331]KAG8880648.1 hypothetical protein FRB98_004962 [Tulasnella sp. 332]
MALLPAPLPLGWTEHIAPSGHTYYFHAQSNQSTYVRPVPAPSQQGPISESKPEDQNVAQKKKSTKKEKPSIKTPIAGTPWIRVKTTAGNIFYTHTERKESVWEVPEEILDLVKALERQEVEVEAAEKIREVGERMASIREGVSQVGKRKAGDVTDRPEQSAGKKARVESESEEEGHNDGGEEDDDETMQKQIAEEIAAAQQSEKPEEDSAMTNVERDDVERETTAKKLPTDYDMPKQVTLSPEESRALFKTLLQEKDISPLTPYDSALPLLIKDPRYVLLPSLADRHAAFNEYCLEKSRAVRASKQQASAGEPSSSSSGDIKAKTREAYEGLLRDELKSTRTGWDEFRKQWKRDRRFFGFGRDDKEREKLFREWRSSLSERKRKAAEIAEANFYTLLTEQKALIAGEAKEGSDAAWKEVKRHKTVHTDPRYDAVGSSSLREELYAAYLKAQAIRATGPNTTTEPSHSADGNEGETEEEAKKRMRRERAEKATREREEQVRREKDKVERQIDRSKGNLTHEKAVEEYMTLLTDAIRDPTATYSGSLELLSRSPVFTRSHLPQTQRVNIFNGHVEKLCQKQLSALHAVFEGYTPGLDAQFKDLPPSVAKSVPAVKLGLESDDPATERGLRRIYDEWQTNRTKRARVEFDELLGENSFVEFWGGLGKMDDGKGGGDGTVVPGVDSTDEKEEGEEGEGGGGRADLKALAKSIGGRQIEDVLKHDRRYRVFNHVPQEREQWIKDYISRMSAPKLSVHVANE